MSLMPVMPDVLSLAVEAVEFKEFMHSESNSLIDAVSGSSSAHRAAIRQLLLCLFVPLMRSVSPVESPDVVLSK